MILRLNAKNDVHRLAEGNVRLAYKIAENFCGCGIEKEELQGFALLGLVKAAATFDEARGYKFSTYAVPVIRNEILRELRRGKNYQGTISLDSEVQSSKDEGKSTCTLLDLLPYEETQFGIVENSDLISSLITCVSGLEREVIVLTILGGDTQEEAARKLNITQSYVSRCVKSGVEKIRKQYYMQGRKLA